MRIKKSNIVASSLMSNIVEYYDFGIYAIYASEIGHIFFPHVDRLVEVMSAMTVFAVSLLARPLGGLIFGHIGDRYGRRRAIMISMVGMSLSSLLISFLPGYNDIAIAAPILLAVSRIVQGLCIGGEGVGSAIFLIEHFQRMRPALIGSIVQASAMGGVLLAQAVAKHLVVTFPEEETWRYAYFIGACMGVVGFYFRTVATESPALAMIKKKRSTVTVTPIVEVFKKCKVELVYIAAIAALATSLSYTVRSLLTIYFEKCFLCGKELSIYYSMFSLSLFIVMLPICGFFADKTGCKIFMRIAAILTIILSGPAFLTLYLWKDNYIFVYLALFVLSILAAAACAPAYPYAINSIKRPELRYSGVGVSWNIGVSIFGGLTVKLGTYMSLYVHPISVSIYLILVALLFIAVSSAFYRYKSRKYGD